MSSIIRNIIFGILLIVIILLVIHFFRGTNSHLSGLNPGNKLVKIPSSKIASNKNSNNYAYSIWFYVSDWQYRLSSDKALIDRKSNGGNSYSNPHISLASHTNDIKINVETVGGNNSNNNCSIRNFPLQRWVNLIVSLNGRTLDVYLDGKLVRTCILPGVAKPIGESDIDITPGGGFSGWTSRLKYWAKPLNPQEAYNVYKEGPGGGTSWTNIFEKYKLKITYLVDNVEEGSISI